MQQTRRCESSHVFEIFLVLMFRVAQKPTSSTELPHLLTTPRNLTKSEQKFNVYRPATRKTITLVKESEILATYPAYYTLLYIGVLTILRNLLINHWRPHFLWRFDPISGHGLPLWVSRSQSLDMPHLVGLIWTSVQHEQTPLPDNT